MDRRMSFGESGDSIRVLLVEDSPGDAVLLQRRLANADASAMLGRVEVTHVESLTAAIQAMSEDGAFHAVLLDLGLPESHGLNTLRRFHEHSDRVPIVVLTGLDDDELAHNAVAAGADDFLKKDGLTSEALVRTLRYSIDRAMRSRELRIKTDAIDFAELAMVLREERGDARTNIYVNRAFETLSGYTAEDMESLEVEELFDEKRYEGEADDLHSALAEGDKVRFETVMVTKDGERFWVSVGVIPVDESPGDARHILFTLEDVSARHEMLTSLADLDRMITLGTLSAAVAHEINNPLAFIGGNVHYALREISRTVSEFPEAEEHLERAVEALEDAMEGSERVRVVVQDLRDLAGGGTPNPPTMKERISVEKALRTSLNMIRKQVEYRAELVADVADGLPDVLGNTSKLGQVFLNLILNAAQAIPKDQENGKVHVKVWQDGESIVAEVRDNGKGIEADSLERIFDPFYSTKPSQEGTGLGLAICKQTLTRMGGEIDVESTLGEGTTFRVTLPTVERRMREWSEMSDANLSEITQQDTDFARKTD